MRVGDQWTNAHGETVTVTERGLSVSKSAQNAAAPRTVAPPRTPPSAPPPRAVPQEPAFLPPVPYWETKR